LQLDGEKSLVVSPPPDKRNTETKSPKHPPAILTPPEWGVVLPFRWVEQGRSGPNRSCGRPPIPKHGTIMPRRLNHPTKCSTGYGNFAGISIKATTFAGLYVDGDRERIPYEADAYLNQLSHYYTDNDVQMARRLWQRAPGTDGCLRRTLKVRLNWK